MKHPFLRCTLECTDCRAAVASVLTARRTVPRKQLYREARENGGQTDQDGNWFCNARCRMNHRLRRGVHHVETPALDGTTKSG